jgi:Lsr2
MQRVELQLEDDLTGGPADETVTFGVDGRAYEIDLNAKHAATFRNQLAAFVEHARLVPRRRSRMPGRTAASRERSREIRAWAEKEGLVVAEYGRLPASVIHEYDLALSTAPSARRTARASGRSHAPAVRRSSARTGDSRRRTVGIRS